jgi:hypothetical protein
MYIESASVVVIQIHSDGAGLVGCHTIIGCIVQAELTRVAALKRAAAAAPTQVAAGYVIL